MNNATVNNIELGNYHARHLHIPNPGRKPIIFIPGNLQEIETITEINQGLCKHFDYHVIELPGTGLTTPLHPSKSIDFLVGCLQEFITKQLNNVHFSLVSCSYATAIAIEYAKAFPNYLDKLVLAGSMPEVPQAQWENCYKLMWMSKQDRKNFSKEFIDRLTAEDALIPRLIAIKKAAARRAFRYSEDQIDCFLYNTLRLLAYKATCLNKIQCPTLCFTGEFDPFVTPSECLKLSKLITGASFQLIPNTDHLFHIESPNETVNIITNYLQNQEAIAA